MNTLPPGMREGSTVRIKRSLQVVDPNSIQPARAKRGEHGVITRKSDDEGYLVQFSGGRWTHLHHDTLLRLAWRMTYRTPNWAPSPFTLTTHEQRDLLAQQRAKKGT